jgi:hypothetical protein
VCKERREVEIEFQQRRENRLHHQYRKECHQKDWKEEEELLDSSGEIGNVAGLSSGGEFPEKKIGIAEIIGERFESA